MAQEQQDFKFTLLCGQVFRDDETGDDNEDIKNLTTEPLSVDDEDDDE